MEKLREEIGELQRMLQSGAQPSIIKKIYSIDSEKLKENYGVMFSGQKDLEKRAKIEFVVNWKDLIKNI